MTITIRAKSHAIDGGFFHYSPLLFEVLYLGAVPLVVPGPVLGPVHPARSLHRHRERSQLEAAGAPDHHAPLHLLARHEDRPPAAALLQYNFEQVNLGKWENDEIDDKLTTVNYILDESGISFHLRRGRQPRPTDASGNHQRVSIAAAPVSFVASAAALPIVAS